MPIRVSTLSTFTVLTSRTTLAEAGELQRAIDRALTHFSPDEAEAIMERRANRAIMARFIQVFAEEEPYVFLDYGIGERWRQSSNYEDEDEDDTVIRRRKVNGYRQFDGRKPSDLVKCSYV